MRDYFEIKTLSDCIGCNNKKILRDAVPSGPAGGGMSPIEIILGGWSVIQSFLGLFGGSRRLTSDDWNKLFPASGYWTNQLRTYLASHITWDTDLKNIEPYTQHFIHINLPALTNNKYQSKDTSVPSSEWNQIVNAFYQTLDKEKQGTSNGTTAAGMFGDLGIGSLLLVGGLAYMFLSSPSKKRRASR